MNKAPQTRSLTLRQIAELAGTSKSTVSRVLTNHPRISAGTRERVLRIINEQAYRPNLFARALAGGRTGQLGVVSSNISSGFFADVIRGIDIAAGLSRGHLLVSFAHGDDDYVRLLGEVLGNGQVDGLILIDPPLALFQRVLPDSHVPIVLCASSAPATARSWGHADSVTVDNSNIMKRIVTHLAEQGIQRMVHLAGPPNVFDAQQRRNAFEDAAKGLGIPEWRVVDGCLVQQNAAEVMRREFADRREWPDAFVAFNDSVALGVLAEVRRAPAGTKRVAVTGWDNTPAADVLDLTSAEMPLTRLGETAVRLLLARIEDGEKADAPGQTVVLDMDLHIRGSSRLAVEGPGVAG